MSPRILKSLAMPKYARLLPRLFPGAIAFEMRGKQGDAVWSWKSDAKGENSQEQSEEPIMAWANYGGNIGRRSMPDGTLQFRCPVLAKSFGEVGWLITTYDTQVAAPVDSAPEPLKRAFADAASFIQEEIDLQTECNQLAVELTERYEELNLVYTTDDQVEHFEEGQDALRRLVHNCTDYLDVGMAALIRRDQGVVFHELNANEAPNDIEALLELLETNVYDLVESQVAPVVLNELDKGDRQRLLGGREENLVAYPVIDDYGVCIGLIAVIARQDLHTFSNGDRNLLEVLAKKASRIIHTHHDSLTGLLNRGGFESSLVSAFGKARSGNLEHCLLHIDIDQLHVINDLMGHQEGDKLIRRVAKVLRGGLRDTDCLARLGGDEFGVLLHRCGMSKAFDVATKINKAIRELDVIAANRQLNVTTSVGIASMTQDSEGIVGVLASAEIACKAAKDNGRDRIQVFEEDNTTLVRRSEDIGWMGQVQQALRDDGFLLYCQPVTPILDSTKSQHFEVLLRMKGENGEVLSPAAFMPAAERYQLMPMVDRWVIRQTLKWLGENWDSLGSASPVVCINLSGQSLTNPGFLAYIDNELDQSGVPAANICFEITETAAISNIDDAIRLMNALRAVGCRFSLDDFGAGLSSFGYLKKLPVEYLKIDGSFVEELTSDPVSHSMVQAICGIGNTMGLQVVAEYVADNQTVELLRAIGVDYAQGYGIGKPQPLADVMSRIEQPSAKVPA